MKKPLIANVSLMVATDEPEEKLIAELKEFVGRQAQLFSEVVTCARVSFCHTSIKDMDEADALMLLLEGDMIEQAGLQDGEVVDGVELKQRLEMHLGERES